MNEPIIDIWLGEAIREQELRIADLRVSLRALVNQDSLYAKAHLVMIQARMNAIRAFQDALMGPALSLRDKT